MDCDMPSCSAYCNQWVTTSWSGQDLAAGHEWSAELFKPAPSQTGGLRCTVGSARRLLKLERGARECPRDEQKGAMSKASCVAREAGYSAVCALR